MGNGRFSTTYLVNLKNSSTSIYLLQRCFIVFYRFPVWSMRGADHLKRLNCGMGAVIPYKIWLFEFIDVEILMRLSCFTNR